MRILRCLGIAVAILFLLGAPAGAIGILDNLLTVTIDGVGSVTISGDQLGCVSGQKAGTYSCHNGETPLGYQNAGYGWEFLNWDLVLDTDPFVSSAFGFKNMGPTATFTIVVSLPIVPVGPTSLMGGSTGGSVTDSNFDGAGGVSTVTPAALYSGMIDGAVVGPAADLHPDPFSVGYGGIPGATGSIPAASFGLPGPTVPGPAALASIGIQNKFSLSTGDSIAMSSFFVIVPIPEPSTALLVCAGLGVLALRKRLA